MGTTSTNAKHEYAQGLRDLADWLETTDLDVHIPTPGHTMNVFTWNRNQFNRASAELGGSREKLVEGSFAITRRTFGPHKVDVNISRDQVCTQVQVGTRTVPARPAVPAAIEPVYEWVCEPVLVLVAPDESAS